MHKTDKEALAMCNLSDGIEQRGIEKGINKVVLKMLQTNHPVKSISEVTDFSETKIKDIAKEHGINLA